MAAPAVFTELAQVCSAGDTALHRVQPLVLQYLEEKSREEPKEGEENNDHEVIRALVRLQNDLVAEGNNVALREMWTALKSWGTTRGDYSLMTRIVNGNCCRFLSMQTPTILHIAMQKGNVDLVEEIVARTGREFGFTSFAATTLILVVAAIAADENDFQAPRKMSTMNALQIGARAGRAQAIERLLSNVSVEDRIALLKAANEERETAMHLAAMFAGPDSLATIFNSAPDNQRSSLLEALTENGQTVLHYASQAENPANIVFLFSAAASSSSTLSHLWTEVTDTFGLTALQTAILRFSVYHKTGNGAEGADQEEWIDDFNTNSSSKMAIYRQNLTIRALLYGINIVRGHARTQLATASSSNIESNAAAAAVVVDVNTASSKRTVALDCFSTDSMDMLD